MGITLTDDIKDKIEHCKLSNYYMQLLRKHHCCFDRVLRKTNTFVDI
jgi:hypothetical protein